MTTTADTFSPLSMAIPTSPFIALYGSHSGDWREPIVASLKNQQIAYYDPTDPAWQSINEQNGDDKQADINALVAKQHSALRAATCVIFHLAYYRTEQGIKIKTNEQGQAASLTSFAARCELGFLTGLSATLASQQPPIPVFVHIEDDTEGRHYLWAQMAMYPHMVRCTTLQAATEQALNYFAKQQANRPN